MERQVQAGWMGWRVWRRWWIWLGVVVLLALGGCGGKTAGEGAKDSSGDAAGALRIAYPAEPRRIDPAFSKDFFEGVVSGFLFDGLVGFGRGDEIEPRLAESWTTSTDLRTYTFRLRENARFADGRPVRAADVRYSFERVLHPGTGSERKWVLDRIDGAAEFTSGTADHVRGISLPEGPDGRTVAITLVRPAATFLTLLAMPAASVIAENSGGKLGEKPDAAADRDAARRVVGTGPWVLDRWAPDRALEFRPNEHFWGERPKLPRLHYVVQSDDTVRRRQFEVGNLDIYQVGFQEWEAYRDERRRPRGSALENVQELRTDFIGINTAKEALRDPRVRRALAHAINTPEIFEQLQKARGTLAAGPLPPGVEGYRPERKPRVHDVEAAKALLDEALGAGGGEGGGRRLRLQLWYRDEALNSEIVAAVREDLAEIGVEITPMPRDQTALRTAIWEGQADLFLGSWTLDYPDPEAALGPTFHSRNIPRQGNQTYFSEPETDRLIDAAMSEADPAKRVELWQQVEDRVVELVPWIPLFHPKMYYATAPRVEGFRPALMYNANRYTGVQVR